MAENTITDDDRWIFKELSDAEFKVLKEWWQKVDRAVGQVIETRLPGVTPEDDADPSINVEAK